MRGGNILQLLRLAVDFFFLLFDAGFYKKKKKKKKNLYYNINKQNRSFRPVKSLYQPQLPII